MFLYVSPIRQPAALIFNNHSTPHPSGTRPRLLRLFATAIQAGIGRCPNGTHPLPSSGCAWFFHQLLRARPATMSGFVKKAKKKAGLLVDKLRPSSTSPAPPAADPVPAAPSSNRHTYADPSAPPTAVATTASAIYELLAVTRDGSDMFLPLKAALTGVVKIWDICEACACLLIHKYVLILLLKRTKQVKEEYEKLESRLAHLNAVTQAYGKKDHLDPDLKLRLDSIA